MVLLFGGMYGSKVVILGDTGDTDIAVGINVRV